MAEPCARTGSSGSIGQIGAMEFPLRVSSSLHDTTVSKHCIHTQIESHNGAHGKDRCLYLFTKSRTGVAYVRYASVNCTWERHNSYMLHSDSKNLESMATRTHTNAHTVEMQSDGAVVQSELGSYRAAWIVLVLRTIYHHGPLQSK